LYRIITVFFLNDPKPEFIDACYYHIIFQITPMQPPNQTIPECNLLPLFHSQFHPQVSEVEVEEAEYPEKFHLF